MGSPSHENGRDDDEGPQHNVQIVDRFAAGRYPVTFDEYDRFAQASGQERHKGAPTDGSAWTSGDCSRRVLRGVPRSLVRRACARPYRDRSGTDDRYHIGGFRLPGRSAATEAYLLILRLFTPRALGRSPSRFFEESC